MLLVGLTGSIGCGKSTVASCFASLGARIIDADHLARLAVAPGSSGLMQVVASFGSRVLGDDGTLDRKAMGRIIFADGDKKTLLESIIHPEIVRLQRLSLADIARHEPDAIVVLDIPLLFETSAQTRLDETVVVTCGAAQWSRLQARGGMEEEVLRRVIAGQMPEAQKVAQADHRIDNAGSLAQMQEQVAALMARFKGMTGRAWPAKWGG